MDRRLSRRLLTVGLVLVIALSVTAGVGLGASTSPPTDSSTLTLTPLQIDPGTPTPDNTSNTSNASNTSNTSNGSTPGPNGTGTAAGSSPTAGNSSDVGGLPAPTGENSTGSPQAPGPGAGNATGTGTAANNSSGNSSGGGGIISGATSAVGGAVGGAVPSPGDWVGGILKWVHNDLRDGIAGFIDDFNFILTGVLHPGDPLDPTTWPNPDGELWTAVWQVYALSMGLSIPLHVHNFMTALDQVDEQGRHRRLKESGTGLAMSIIGPAIIGLTYGGTHLLTQALSPSGVEFLATPEDVSKLGIGLVAGVIASVANTSIIGTGLAARAAMQFILVFVAATWPIWWGMRPSQIALLRTKGNFMLSSVGVILLILLVQSLILRFLFWMPWGEAGPGTQLFLLVMIIVGLFVAMWGLPYYGVKQTTTAAGFALGMSFVPKGTSPSRAYSGAKSRVNSARSTLSRAGGRASQTGKWAKQKASRTRQRAGAVGSGGGSGTSTSSGSSGSGSGSGTRSGTTAGHSSANSSAGSGSSSGGRSTSTATRSRLTSASTGNQNLSRRSHHISKRSNRPKRSSNRNSAASAQRSPGSRRPGTTSNND